MQVLDLDVGQVARGRHEVVREARGEHLAVVVVEVALVEDGRDALRDAAADLAVDDGRVDQLAAVLDDEVPGMETAPVSTSTSTKQQCVDCDHAASGTLEVARGLEARAHAVGQ